MATITLSCNYYKLEKINSTVSAYQKNGTMSLGRNVRDNSYVSEILCNPLNITNIPVNSVIDSVTINYNIVTNNIVTSTSGYIKIFKEDKGVWSDTGTAPVYSTFASTPWATLQLTDTYVNQPSTPTGSYSISGNNTFISLVSRWVNGTENKNGFIMALDFGYYGSYLTVNSINLDIVYTQSLSINNAFLYYKRTRK